ncbi:ferredoxin [Streptomyces sp. NPDC047071]|uniref:ferredoxin n=1 Tax=Streptomyces sp. NPDC047071 TaxID=3154808 RepID=UPI0034547B3D
MTGEESATTGEGSGMTREESATIREGSGVTRKESVVRVRVDRARCASSGLCLAQVPEVFDQSDTDGRVLLLDPDPGPGLTARVRAALARCPSGAITLRGPGGPGHDLEET